MRPTYLTPLPSPPPTGFFPPASGVSAVPIPALADDVNLRDLSGRYSALLRNCGDGCGPYIVSLVLKTSCGIPEFHERLLKAVVESFDVGTRRQANCMQALQRLFEYRSLRTSGGSWRCALLELFIRCAVAEGDGRKRSAAMKAVFEAMDEGIPDDAMEGLLGHFGYANSGREILTEHQNRLRQRASEAEIYPKEDIEQALDYVLRHPLRSIAFERLARIVIKRDLPAKVKEFRDEVLVAPTLVHLGRMSEKGIPPEEMARSICGTVHTAYMNDMRLARKVVSVMLAVEGFYEDHDGRARRRAGLRASLSRLVSKGWPPDMEEFLEIYRTTGFSGHQIPKGPHVSFKSWEELLALAQSRGLSVSSMELFLPSLSPGLPDRIYLRTPEPTVESLVDCLISLSHAEEHWRHHHGHYEGMEAGGTPLPVGDKSRHSFLVREMMSCLEEQRARVPHYDTDLWTQARMMGVNLAMLFRMLNDR